ncbi:hypothetical protein ACQJBY_004690 [Aegilops geniculata]
MASWSGACSVRDAMDLVRVKLSLPPAQERTSSIQGRTRRKPHGAIYRTNRRANLSSFPSDFMFAILGEPGVLYGEAKQQPTTPTCDSR